MNNPQLEVQEALRALSVARRRIESLGTVVQSVNKHEERRQDDARETHLRVKELEAENEEMRKLLGAARPYLRGIRAVDPAPYMDGSAYPGWLDEPRTVAKKPAEWWNALTMLQVSVDILLNKPT